MSLEPQSQPILCDQCDSYLEEIEALKRQNQDLLAHISEAKRKSSELQSDKNELTSTLDFITNENGELNEKLLALTTRLEQLETEKNEFKESADKETSRRRLCEKNFQKLEKKYESVKSSNERMVMHESIWKLQPVPPLELSFKPPQKSSPNDQRKPRAPRQMAPPPPPQVTSFKMPDRQEKSNLSSNKENLMRPPNDFDPHFGSIQTQQSQ